MVGQRGWHRNELTAKTGAPLAMGASQALGEYDYPMAMGSWLKVLSMSSIGRLTATSSNSTGHRITVKLPYELPGRPTAWCGNPASAVPRQRPLARPPRCLSASADFRADHLRSLRQGRTLNEAHMRQSDMRIRDTLAKMRHDGCGRRPAGEAAHRPLPAVE
jgi:hypothetical protein